MDHDQKNRDPERAEDQSALRKIESTGLRLAWNLSTPQDRYFLLQALGFGKFESESGSTLTLEIT